MSLEEEPWRASASCQDLPTAWFFPGQYEATLPAKQVCRACPVRSECLEFALENSGTYGKYGIWGGLSEKERRRIVRGRRLKRTA